MGRNRAQNEARRNDQRRHILAHALALFSRRGLSGTKTSDIAAAAGISQGLLYHYYSSKEEVFVALIRHAFEKMTESARALARAPLAPRSKLELAVEALLEGFRHNDDVARYHLLIAIAAASDVIPDEARAVIEEHRRVPYEVVEDIIAAGQLEGTIRSGDPKELALLFWATIKGFAVHRAAYGTADGDLTTRAIMGMFDR